MEKVRGRAFFVGALPAAGQVNAPPAVGTGGHGQPELIFLSESAAPPGEWDHVVARFEVAYRCHVFAPTADGSPLATRADAVVAYAREQGLVQPMLIGHSSGGAVALRAALQAPELRGRLVLVDCQPDPADDLAKVLCSAVVLGALAGPAATTRKAFRREYRRLPQVRFRFFARVGHFLVRDNLDGFTDALRAS